MDITAIHENDNMMGGKVLFELKLEKEEGSAVQASYLGYVFAEPYDDEHLWFWSQVELDGTLDDEFFWNAVSDGLAECDVCDVPSGEQLRQMALDRLEEGNDEGFEGRLNYGC